MILFLIKLIFIFICKELEKGKHLFLFLFYLIFTLICFILTLISIIKNFIISKNVFQCFDNELSNFNKHTNWQIVLEILAIKNLKEKDYVCDAYSTDNGFKIIDNESITQLIEENNLNSINHYDNTSIVYLYKETYIGLSKLNKNRGKIGKIFYIKKFNWSVNIVLFIYMMLFLIKLIFIFICEELEN
jgi:hypothetical protein